VQYPGRGLLRPDGFGEDLDGDSAAEADVEGAIDGAHPPLSDERINAVVPEDRSDHGSLAWATRQL